MSREIKCSRCGAMATVTEATIGMDDPMKCEHPGGYLSCPLLAEEHRKIFNEYPDWMTKK